MKHFIAFSVGSLLACLFVGSVVKAEAEAAGYRGPSVRAAIVQPASDSGPSDPGYWELFAAAAVAQ